MLTHKKDGEFAMFAGTEEIPDEEVLFGRPRPQGARFMTSVAMQELMRCHLLSRDLFPVAVGWFPHEEYHDRPLHLVPVPYALVLYCSHGSGELHTNQRHWPIAAGHLIVLPPETPFYLSPDRGCWSLHWLYFRGDLMREYQHHLRVPSLVTAIGAQTQLIADWDSLIATHASDLTLDVYIDAANRTKGLLSALAITVAGRDATMPSRIDLKALRALMMQHMKDPFDLEWMAASAHMSKFYFSRRFKALTGQAPMEYFIHLKMQRACKQLDDTVSPIKRIAANLGYDDPYYFSRAFKQVMGISPQNYRKRHGSRFIGAI